GESSNRLGQTDPRRGDHPDLLTQCSQYLPASVMFQVGRRPVDPFPFDLQRGRQIARVPHATQLEAYAARLRVEEQDVRLVERQREVFDAGVGESLLAGGTTYHTSKDLEVDVRTRHFQLDVRPIVGPEIGSIQQVTSPQPPGLGF